MRSLSLPAKDAIECRLCPTEQGDETRSRQARGIAKSDLVIKLWHEWNVSDTNVETHLRK
jgi:hypothetical protein